MSTTLEMLFDTIAAEHEHEAAATDAPYAIATFEARAGFSLPHDLRAFYLRFARANLYERLHIIPVAMLARTGAMLAGDEWAKSEPASWFAFCDAGDGNYVGIDLAKADGENLILDCDHENVSTRRVIAKSFTAFLERTLTHSDAPYHLVSDESFPVVEVPYRPPATWLRRHYHAWSLTPEAGPEHCIERDCPRLRVRHSVHCRRHHFESIQRLPYPFDDEV